jgi:hypothetical protein
MKFVALVLFAAAVLWAQTVSCPIDDSPMLMTGQVSFQNGREFKQYRCAQGHLLWIRSEAMSITPLASPPAGIDPVLAMGVQAPAIENSLDQQLKAQQIQRLRLENEARARDLGLSTTYGPTWGDLAARFHRSPHRQKSKPEPKHKINSKYDEAAMANLRLQNPALWEEVEKARVAEQR